MHKDVNTYRFRYCKYVLIHTDEIMKILHKTHAIMKVVAKVYYLIKYSETNKTYYEPRRYIFSNVDKFDLPDRSGTVCFM